MMKTFWLNLMIGAGSSGLVPAFIAHKKGHSFILWWAFGSVLFLLALPMAIFIGKMKKCPKCAESVKAEATVCRFCKHEFRKEAPRHEGMSRLAAAEMRVDSALPRTASIGVSSTRTYPMKIRTAIAAIIVLTVVVLATHRYLFQSGITPSGTSSSISNFASPSPGNTTPASSRTGAESAGAKYIVEIDSRAPNNEVFLRPGESVWVYFREKNGKKRARLGGAMTVGGKAGAQLSTIQGKLPEGDYYVYLIRNEGDSNFAVLSCGQSVTLTSGQESRIQFPQPLPLLTCYPYPVNDYWYREETWPYTEESKIRVREGQGWRTHDVSADSSMNITMGGDWGSQAKKIAEYFYPEGCDERSPGLWRVYQQLLKDPPVQPVVFIAGPGFLDSGMMEHFLDMEYDGAMIRLVVKDVKRQCWGWFNHVSFTREEAVLVRSLRGLVEQGKSRVDALNEIADLLDSTRSRQGRQ